MNFTQHGVSISTEGFLAVWATDIVATRWQRVVVTQYLNRLILLLSVEFLAHRKVTFIISRINLD
jgi:hypothetical protein